MTLNKHVKGFFTEIKKKQITKCLIRIPIRTKVELNMNYELKFT